MSSPDTARAMKYKPAASLSATMRFKYRVSGKDCAALRRAGPSKLLKESQLSASGRKKRFLFFRGGVCFPPFHRYCSARSAAS